MASISGNKVYLVPVGRVWETLADLSKCPDWQTAHISFPQGPPASLELSSTFTQKIKNLGIPAEVTWTVTAMEPLRLLELRGRGPGKVSIQTRFQVESVDGGTRLTVDGEFTGAMVRMAGKRLTAAAQADLDNSLARLEAVVG